MAQTTIQKSPAQIGTDSANFSPVSFNRLFIRIESGGSFKVGIKLDGTIPSTTNADMYLDSGDAIEIKGNEVPQAKGSNVNLFALTGNPKIFWYMT